MLVEKFELIADGMKGVTIYGIKNKIKNQVTILVPYSETYPIPVPLELRKRIQDLKKYIAIALNVGLEPHINEVIDKKDKKQTADRVSLVNFLDSLTVTSIQRKAGCFILTGKICNMDNGTIGLATPKITSSTNYGFYQELDELYAEIGKEVLSFIESSDFSKMKAKNYMLDLFANDPEAQATIEGKTDKELEEQMIKSLEEKGHIIYSPNAEDVVASTNEPVTSKKKPDVEEEF